MSHNEVNTHLVFREDSSPNRKYDTKYSCPIYAHSFPCLCLHLLLFCFCFDVGSQVVVSKHVSDGLVKISINLCLELQGMQNFYFATFFFRWQNITNKKSKEKYQTDPFTSYGNFFFFCLDEKSMRHLFGILKTLG